MTIMRLWLLVLLSSATAVAARRGGGGGKVPVSPNAVPPFHPPRRHCLDPWGYPYGWGLDDNCFPAESPLEEQVTQMKEVKRVTPSKQVAPPPQKNTGWFGVKVDPSHPHWKDVDEVMDGFE